MTTKISKALLTLCIAVSLVSVSSVANAYQCRWVHGYYAHGVYYHAHRVCWGNNHHRCAWRNGHRVCW
jgi:hypothetical protein